MMDEAACDKAAMQYARTHREPVSTLTHSTAYVAKHFLQWREKQKVKPTQRVIPGAKAAMAKKTNGGLKGAAFALYSNGYSAKQVSTELNITYANAHYYKRAMAK
jgi:hypothetical protein